MQFSMCFYFWASFSVCPTYLAVCLVGSSGLEPPTSRLSGVRSNRLSYEPALLGGDERSRTADPLLARQVLYQLSYTPVLSVISSHIELF